MARFGGTAALHVVGQVQERIEAPRALGVEAQFAGRQLRAGLARETAGQPEHLGMGFGGGNRHAGSIPARHSS